MVSWSIHGGIARQIYPNSTGSPVIHTANSPCWGATDRPTNVVAGPSNQPDTASARGTRVGEPGILHLVDLPR